jgi:hypothetical protein
MRLLPPDQHSAGRQCPDGAAGRHCQKLQQQRPGTG